MDQERLQKVLARCGIGSRRHIEELIRQGRITVNGQLAELGQRADLSVDAIKIDGRRIHAPRRPQHYLLLNKPTGYVSTRQDPEGRPTVYDLLPERFRKVVVPVGRLDFESEGLVLLTDDGDLAQRVSHPSYGCNKTYAVKVKGHPDPSKVERLRQGIQLDKHFTAPAKVTQRRAPTGKRKLQDNTWWTVILAEGRTRQIREMFFRIGHPVARLRRVSIGPIRDTGLPRGKWRDLSAEEVEQLRRKTAQKTARPKPGQRQAEQQRAGKQKAARQSTTTAQSKVPRKKERREPRKK